MASGCRRHAAPRHLQSSPTGHLAVSSPTGQGRHHFAGGFTRAGVGFDTIRQYTVDREEAVRIAVIGGGPGGLYFSYLWKRRHPDAHVDLFEQNPAGATWGFGVVFSDQALEFLRADDPQTMDAIAPRMESWKNITLNLRGESVEIDGVGFSSIGRLELLAILQARAASVGVAARYDTQIGAVDQLNGYDLIVAADGLNSLVRRSFEGDFGTSLSYSANKFAWYGTTKRFETLSQTFVESDLGTFNAHHYRYSPQMSTFLVECDLATWQRYGFADKTVEQSKAICEQIFAATLDGHSLVSNRSVWRNFPWIWNERWSFGNMVLIGDALHSAHFSIGSGTRLAIEDAIALTRALETERELAAALRRYQDERQPIVKKLVAAARASADWYAGFPEHMKLGMMDFAFSYITRSGRIDDARLRAMSPAFMARYGASRPRSAEGG
jgi:2-polyprenyl-6-methoxyphenol hydroxylase-like FAD-dependent oxidoreductase